MIVEVIIFIFLLLIMAIMKDRKPGSMPPGPLEIPFIGNQIADTIETLNKLRGKYGPIYTIRLGVERTVVIADYELAKQALCGVDCIDRSPAFKVFNLEPVKEAGILSSNGLRWMHNRRFILRHLRDLGMGKTYLQTSIQNEAEAMLNYMKDLGDKPTKTPSCFRRVVLNVVWQMVSGKRYELTSPEVDNIFKAMENFRDISTYAVFIEIFFPIVKLIPQTIRTRIFNTQALENFRKEMLHILTPCIEEHKKYLDENNSKDLIDDYLIAIKQNKDNPDNLFNEEDLVQVVSDLFGAGAETVTNMLRWVAFLMVKYPETMRKAQEDIDEVVPTDRLVSLEDKPRLPYIEAYMAEALRYTSMIYVNISHFANNDFKLGGYIIPKGTAVTVDNYFMHHDPKFWKEPSSFNPKRFIGEDGKFNPKLGRNFAFGIGKRECIGLPLAMMEFYLFGSTLLQNFIVELPEGEELNHKVLEASNARTAPNQEFIYRYRH